MPEVRATLSADSSDYTQAFKRAEASHESFFDSEAKMVRSLRTMATEFAHAKDPVEALLGSIGHLGHVFEAGIGAQLALVGIGLVSSKLYEAYENSEKLGVSIERVGQISRYNLAD